METKETTIDELNEIWQQQFEQSVTNEAFLANIDNFNLTTSGELTAESFGDQWLKIIKGVFLYLPGVALLFPCTLFLINAFFTGHFGLSSIIFGLPWLLFCSFMVMFGIGDVKKTKHLALPISITVFSFVVFLVSSFFGDEASWGFMANYSVYLFPIAFILPILVKDLLEND